VRIRRGTARAPRPFVGRGVLPLIAALVALTLLSSCTWAQRLAWDAEHGWPAGTTNHLLVEAHGPQANAHPDAVVALAANVVPYGVWDRLADCESGNGVPGSGTARWNINTGNGYYGGVQFALASWRAAGGTGYPHQHTRSEQIRRAERLLELQGWGAWPTCSRKMGLR
jgi:hypothetical protein